MFRHLGQKASSNTLVSSVQFSYVALYAPLVFVGLTCLLQLSKKATLLSSTLQRSSHLRPFKAICILHHLIIILALSLKVPKLWRRQHWKSPFFDHPTAVYITTPFLGHFHEYVKIIYNCNYEYKYDIHRVSKNWGHFYILNNFVKHWPILILLACSIAKKLDVNNYSLPYLVILSLRYLVKCRSRSLVVYNNEFIRGSACVGSEMINRIVTNMSKSYYL